MVRIKAVIVKEFFHILRDPRSLAIVFIMPLFMIFIYGYSISYDLNRIDAAVVDYSNSIAARQLLWNFANNHYFVLHPQGTENSQVDPLTRAEKLLRQGTVKEIIVIPADFSRRLAAHRPTTVGIVIDGSDSNVANIIHQYSEQLILKFQLEQQHADPPLRISTKTYFNPEGKSSFFFIPGLIAVLLLMISALLTSISVARELESGSIDLLFISPLKSAEIILGKTIPYMLISFATGAVILLFARFWFGIPFHGSLWVLALFSLLYLLSGLSFGILISTITPDQRLAMLATLLITMLPSIMLSGFIFPLDSLPPVLRAFSYLVPATYFLRIIRGVILKGAALRHFLFEGGMMLLFSAVMIGAASAKFSRRRKVTR